MESQAKKKKKKNIKMDAWIREVKPVLDHDAPPGFVTVFPVTDDDSFVVSCCVGHVCCTLVVSVNMRR